MPANDVDETAIAIVVEAELDDRLPAEGSEFANEQLDDGRMVAVKQQRAFGASPTGHEIEPDLESGAHSLDRGPRQRVEPAAVDA